MNKERERVPMKRAAARPKYTATGRRGLSRLIGATSVWLWAAALVQAAPAQEFDVASLENGHMWQSRMLARANPDSGCRAQYGLSELEGDGEHTVYQAVEMPEEVGVRIRMRAGLRYGVQIGFASHDWSSYSLANVSLTSGAYAVTEGGSLKAVRSSVTARPDGWMEVSFSIANQRRPRGGEDAMGFAFIKLTADGGLKEYRGRPGHGIELCAINR